MALSRPPDFFENHGGLGGTPKRERKIYFLRTDELYLHHKAGAFFKIGKSKTVFDPGFHQSRRGTQAQVVLMTI